MTKKDKMIEAIDVKIRMALWAYNNGDEKFYSKMMMKINGMVEILEIATDKQYSITEYGLKER